MNKDNDNKTEQPLMLQSDCVECKWYDGFGQCLEHGDKLVDGCADFCNAQDETNNNRD